MELQTSVYVAVTKDITDDLSSVIQVDSQIHGKYKSQDSMPYVVVSVSYDGLCKLL